MTHAAHHPGTATGAHLWPVSATPGVFGSIGDEVWERNVAHACDQYRATARLVAEATGVLEQLDPRPRTADDARRRLVAVFRGRGNPTTG